MEQEKYQEVEGIVEEIIFQNEDNGYTVMEFLTLEKNMTVVGTLPYIYEGESLKLWGSYTTHSEYGEQFKVAMFEKSVPKTKSAILSFLSSGIIKGIRTATAKKIVEKFGAKALDVIEAEPEKLSSVRGITYEKALEIGNSYREKKNLSDLIIFLQKYQISIHLVMKISRALGASPISQIEENPYVLCDKIEGISFLTADQIAKNMGVSKNDQKRIQSGIKYTLQRAALNGHTYLTDELLSPYTARILEVTETEVHNALFLLTSSGGVVREKGEAPRYYLPALYLAERNIANKLKLLQFEKAEQLYYEKVEEDIFSLCQIQLATRQKEAVKAVLSNNLTVITGGPGTGKTTIINSIIAIAEKRKLQITLTAPTGRAAKRMSEVCGREAKTIHRLLEVTFGANGGDRFFKNEDNPLKTDLIIIDEMSMVDVVLFQALLSAVKIGTRMVLVGDSNQLPSVGAGNVLKDVIDSGLFPCVSLNEIFRQEKESLIVANAHQVLKGEFPRFNGKDSDFFIIRKNNSAEVMEEVVSLFQGRILNFFQQKKDLSIQLLTPMKKTVLGTISINNELQKVMNPPIPGKKEKKWGKYTFREGDKVIQTRNNYEIEWHTAAGETGTGAFNGDSGIIRTIDKDRVVIEFYDGKIAEYDFSKLEDIDLAYAITVHKSQGSEFDVVVLPLLYGPKTLLHRNLFYTAITRAKSLVVIVGSCQCVEEMIQNHKETERYTGLRDQLLEE